tara:strand:- start:1300 stop:1620 length:321 start_codon:yes stop_codon:yes gene_type:complete
MKRNNDQNSLFHVIARDIAEHVTKDAIEQNKHLPLGEQLKPCSERMVKAMVQELFGVRLEITVGSTTKTVIVPTSSLSKKQMSELTEQMIAWAAMDLGYIHTEKVA